MKKRVSAHGFTVVELLLAIAVMSIIAGIVILSYGGWKKSTSEVQVKSDLSNVAASMESARNFGSGYPVAIPTTIQASQGVALALYASDVKTFCVDGSFTSDASIKYYVDETNKQPKAGTCSTRSGTSVLTAPTGLSVSIPTSAQVIVSWTAVSGATSYTAQCSPDAAYLINTKEVTSTVASATFTTLAANATYNCRVKAKDGANQSDWSTTLTFNTATTPTLTVTATGYTTINTSWTGTVGTKYEIQMSGNATFSDNLAIAGQTTLSKAYSGLTPATIYYFHVRTLSIDNEPGPWSGVMSATTQTIPPAGGRGTNVDSSTQISVTWTAVSGATAYKVEWSTASNFSPITGSVQVGASPAVVTGLSQGKQYYFRIYTIVGSNMSVASASVNDTTTIDTPSAPTVTLGATGDTTTWSWVGASCPSGTTKKYYYAFKTDAVTGAVTTGAEVGPVTSTSASNSATTSEGALYGIRVIQVCTTTAVTSDRSVAGNNPTWLVPLDAVAAKYAALYVTSDTKAQAKIISVDSACSSGTNLQVAWATSKNDAVWPSWADTTFYTYTLGNAFQSGASLASGYKLEFAFRTRCKNLTTNYPSADAGDTDGANYPVSSSLYNYGNILIRDASKFNINCYGDIATSGKSTYCEAGYSANGTRGTVATTCKLRTTDPDSNNSYSALYAQGGDTLCW